MDDDYFDRRGYRLGVLCLSTASDRSLFSTRSFPGRPGSLPRVLLSFGFGRRIHQPDTRGQFRVFVLSSLAGIYSCADEWLVGAGDVGSIIKITRNQATSGETSFYRYVDSDLISPYHYAISEFAEKDNLYKELVNILDKDGLDEEIKD